MKKGKDIYSYYTLACPCIMTDLLVVFDYCKNAKNRNHTQNVIYYIFIFINEHTHTYMENLMVIRVEVIAPEKPLLSKHLQK